jgi:hypothetical protein
MSCNGRRDSSEPHAGQGWILSGPHVRRTECVERFPHRPGAINRSLCGLICADAGWRQRINGYYGEETIPPGFEMCGQTSDERVGERPPPRRLSRGGFRTPPASNGSRGNGARRTRGGLFRRQGGFSALFDALQARTGLRAVVGQPSDLRAGSPRQRFSDSQS